MTGDAIELWRSHSMDAAVHTGTLADLVDHVLFPLVLALEAAPAR